MWARCLSSVLLPVKEHQTRDSALFDNLNMGATCMSYRLVNVLPSCVPFTFSSVVFCDSSAVKNVPEIEPLLNAIRSGASLKDISLLLMTSKIDPQQTDAESWTCLHWAVEMGRCDLVPAFLDVAPLLLHMKTNEGLSAINIAAWRGDRAMVALLLKQGAEIDEKTKWGETPLHHAVTFGHLSVAEFLLSQGADAFMEDRLQRSPFQIAMQKGSEEMKKLFAPFSTNKN